MPIEFQESPRAKRKGPRPQEWFVLVPAEARAGSAQQDSVAAVAAAAAGGGDVGCGGESVILTAAQSRYSLLGVAMWIYRVDPWSPFLTML